MATLLGLLYDKARFLHQSILVVKDWKYVFLSFFLNVIFKLQRAMDYGNKTTRLVFNILTFRGQFVSSYSSFVLAIISLDIYQILCTLLIVFIRKNI